jgi:hypothetical protein
LSFGMSRPSRSCLSLWFSANLNPTSFRDPLFGECRSLPSAMGWSRGRFFCWITRTLDADDVAGLDVWCTISPWSFCNWAPCSDGTIVLLVRAARLAACWSESR